MKKTEQPEVSQSSASGSLSIAKADLQKAIGMHARDYYNLAAFGKNTRELFKELKKICERSEDGVLDDISLIKLIAVLVFYGTSNSHIQPIVKKIKGDPKKNTVLELTQEIYLFSSRYLDMENLKPPKSFTPKVQDYLAFIVGLVLEISPFLTSTMSENDKLYAAFYLARLHKRIREVYSRFELGSIKKLKLLLAAIDIETYEKICWYSCKRDYYWSTAFLNLHGGHFVDGNERKPGKKSISAAKEALRPPKLSWLKTVVSIDQSYVGWVVENFQTSYDAYRDVKELQAKIMLVLSKYPNRADGITRVIAVVKKVPNILNRLLNIFLDEKNFNEDVFHFLSFFILIFKGGFSNKRLLESFLDIAENYEQRMKLVKGLCDLSKSISKETYNILRENYKLKSDFLWLLVGGCCDEEVCCRVMVLKESLPFLGNSKFYFLFLHALIQFLSETSFLGDQEVEKIKELCSIIEFLTPDVTKYEDAFSQIRERLEKESYRKSLELFRSVLVGELDYKALEVVYKRLKQGEVNLLEKEFIFMIKNPEFVKILKRMTDSDHRTEQGNSQGLQDDFRIAINQKQFYQGKEQYFYFCSGVSMIIQRTNGFFTKLPSELRYSLCRFYATGLFAVKHPKETSTQKSVAESSTVSSPST